MMIAIYIFLSIRFFNHVFKQGAIFGFVGQYVDSPRTPRIIRQLAKPLFYCCVCMSPWYSLAYLVADGSLELVRWLILAGSVGGLNVIYDKLTDYD